MLMANFVLAMALFNATPNPSTQLPATPAEARQTADRSLGFLEKQGLAWLDNRKCIGCHHGAWMVWIHNEARSKGFAVEAARVEGWTSRVLAMYLTEEAQHQQKKAGYVEASHLLLSQLAASPAIGPTSDSLKKAQALLVNAQLADGSWKFAGQTQDRPNEEADQATTLWALYALASLDIQDEAVIASRDRARAWYQKAKLGASNELLAVRLALAYKFGETEQVQELTRALVGQQNADGGWSWSKGRASDAYATGQSLYALGLAGLPSDSPAVQKAWRFLASTQKPDGSWLAPTKKKNGKDEISSYWGTTWAALGLVRTLPPRSPVPIEE